MTWDSPVEAYMDLVEDRVTNVLRRMGVYALKGVVSASPVQDGPFRGNHNVGIGKADHSTGNPADKSGGPTLSRGNARLAGSPGYPTIFVSNALPYADALEGGHSKQAEDGVYGITFVSTLARFEDELRDA